jgi:hypothetical protein
MLGFGLSLAIVHSASAHTSFKCFNIILVITQIFSEYLSQVSIVNLQSAIKELTLCCDSLSYKHDRSSG